jgi:PAS domain S-box-containing protein
MKTFFTTLKPVYTETHSTGISTGQIASSNVACSVLEDCLEKDHRFRLLIEHSFEVVILCDANFKSFYRSPSGMALLGLTNEDLEKQEGMSYVHPQDMEQLKGKMQEVIENPARPIKVLFRARHKDGHYIWLEGSVTNMLHEPCLNAIIFNCSDVTERVRSEEELRNNQIMLQGTEHLAHVGSWMADLVTGGAYWSDELYNILGYTKGTVEPGLENFLRAVHPQDLKKLRDSIDHAAAHLNNMRLEFRVLTGAGEIKHILYEMTLKRNEVGEPVLVKGFLMDISDRKTQEFEKEKITADMLVHNKNLEQFGYIVSHNLRAPVANILGSCSLLNDPKTDEATKVTLINYLQVAANKLDEVIKDLDSILQLKRQVNDTKEKICLTDLVEDIKKDLTQAINEKQASIRIDFSEVDEVRSIKGYFHSIFYNLISNALKYQQPCIAPRIEIRSRKVNGKLLLTFKDNGIGIDMEKNDKYLFGLYKRFHMESEGKGVGLFMTKSQVETLGGKISVTSAVNVGSEFMIEMELN